MDGRRAVPEIYANSGHVMSQATIHRPPTSKVRSLSRVSPCVVCGGQNGTGTGFSPRSSVPPTPPPQHCHSTHVSYSLLLLWLVLRNASKWQLCFNNKLFFFLLALQPIVGLYFSALYRPIASSRTRFLDHIKLRATVGRTPLDEWSARRRDLYLTTLTTDKHPSPRWDSNPRSQEVSGRRPTP